MTQTYDPKNRLTSERNLRHRGPRLSEAGPAEDPRNLLHCVPSSSPATRRERRRLLESVFSEEHQPLVTFAARKMGKSREKFATLKCRSAKSIVYRNRWMHNALVILETDPDVVALSHYPVTIRYIATDLDQKTVWKDHVPSLAVMRKDGGISFHDFLHDEDAGAAASRTREIALSLREDFDAEYVVWTATEILAQPRFFNANLIWAHRSSKAHILVSGSLEQDILQQEFPASIREIADRLDTPMNDRGRDGDSDAVGDTPRYGINLVFSTCLRLAADGRIQLDTATQITTSTIIVRRV